MKRKIIKVGLDFDGVVAYNPFRLIRSPITYFKRHILKRKKLAFFYPRKNWQKIFWKIIHESSVFPARGTKLLQTLTKRKEVEVHLITARFSFLDHQLIRWLERYNLKNCFKSVNINEKDEQPHLYKKKVVEKLRLDYYVEDNWDIVNYLNKNLDSSKGKGEEKKRRIKIFWIYNLIDRNVNYKLKFPYLERALINIQKNINIEQ